MIRVEKAHPLVLVLVSGLLLSAAWYIYPFFAFIGFVPLLLLNRHFEDKSIKKRGIKFFFCAYLGFLLWNFVTTWWIINSTIVGALLAFFINSLLMCIPLMLFRWTAAVIQKSKFKLSYPEFLLIPFWVAFEYLHLDWDLSWTWLNMGNCFSFAHYFVQWYSFTGILGGTIWILTVNILLYRFIVFSVKDAAERPVFMRLAPVFLVVCIPVLLSLVIYLSYQENGEPSEIVVVQPNIDPYTEKFRGTPSFIPYEQQLTRLIALSERKISTKTKFLAWPETSLPAGYDEDLIEDQPNIRLLRSFLEKYPNVTLITGADTYKIYLSEYDKSQTARFEEGIGYYDYFNTALRINSKSKASFYHKSKLVPGVEQMPYPAFFKFIETFAIDLGGITGTLGKQNERTVFFDKGKVGAAPVICYESIFGAFVGEYIRNGANYILIVTNDAWWGNTPGHVQHFAYARLRAIETRRSVARAANTGISGFIDQKGNVIASSTYATQDVMSVTLPGNSSITFYALYGDYLGIMARYISMALIFISAYFIVFTKITGKKNES